MPDNARKNKLPPLFVIRATIGLRNFLLKVAQNMLPASYIMLEESSKIWKVKAIEIAVSLDISGLLKDRPQKVEKLAEITGTDASSLYRILRALAGEGIFRELPDTKFENTRLSRALSEQKDSVKYFVMHHIGNTNWELTGDMMHCLKTGSDAFIHKFNTTPFEHLEKYPQENEIFNKAMTETSELSGDILVSSYPFGRYKTIVDIGGGQGLLLAQILKENKSSKGILYDQPHVVATARENMKKERVDDRCIIVEGSFFESIPNNGDLYILKNIIHDWDDETSVRILKNIHENMSQQATLLMVETIIKTDNKPSFGKFIDLQMMIGTPGGKERTRQEYTDLLQNAGFRLARVINNATPFSFLEAVKK